jgi:hypothetical protein
MNGIRHDGPRVRNLRVMRDDTHDRWITKQVAVTAQSRQEKCVLPQKAETILVGTDLEITVEKPAGLTGHLYVASLSHFAWDADDPISLPPGLNNPEAAEFFQPLSFSHSPGASPGVLVLDTKAKQLSAISAETPLRIELSVENDPAIAGVVPVAFDGEYYYLVGHPVEAKTVSQYANRRRMALEITHLPAPETGESGATAGNRSAWRLGRTMRRLVSGLQQEWRRAESAVGNTADAEDGIPVCEQAADGIGDHASAGA